MADAYEREQMPGVGEVLFRDKVSSPPWMQALVTVLVAGMPLGLSLAGAAALAFAGMWIGAALALAGGLGLSSALAFLLFTFSTARIAVSEGELHVQFGFAGPKIPIDQVAAVELAPSGINKVGMGVGKDLRGTTYYRLWGDNRNAVHVSTKDGKRWVFVLKEATAMHAALVEAMARRDRKGPRVRVEASQDDVIEQSDSEQSRQARARQHGA